MIERQKSNSGGPQGQHKEKVQKGFSRALIAAAKKGLPIISVSADLQGSTGVLPFHQEFPQLKIDVGVAESNAISTAIGLSKRGMIPIVDTFVQFGATKGNLPLIMAGLGQGPVIALFSHLGMQDAADGASHQSTTYLSALAGIPQLNAVVCATSEEANAYMSQVLEHFAAQKESGCNSPQHHLFNGTGKLPPHLRPQPLLQLR